MASWLVRDRIISFSSVEILFFSDACLRWGIWSHTLRAQEYSDMCMQICCQALQMEPIRSKHLLWLKCPKHTFSLQITCELFFLNDWPLPHYGLTVCTRFSKIHLKAIQCCCVRQEASVLAHRVILSDSRTQRGISSLVSLLLAFKECLCVCNVHAHARMFMCVCSCMHMSLVNTG